MTTTDPKLIEPVAWMYEDENGSVVVYRNRVPLPGFVIETPLYTAAAINEAVQNERAGIVAWLRAYDRDETNWPQFLANAIERGEHLPSPPAINEAAHQWQDIATAPRDWDDVLVFSPEHEGFNCGGVFSAFYDTDAGKWATHGPFGNIELQPTHWQPLPSPPAIEAKESQHG